VLALHLVLFSKAVTQLVVDAVRLIRNAIAPVFAVTLVFPVVGELDIGVSLDGLDIRNHVAVELGEVDGTVALVIPLLLGGLLASLLLLGALVGLLSSTDLSVLLVLLLLLDHVFLSLHRVFEFLSFSVDDLVPELRVMPIVLAHLISVRNDVLGVVFVRDEESFLTNLDEFISVLKLGGLGRTVVMISLGKANRVLTFGDVISVVFVIICSHLVVELNEFKGVLLFLLSVGVINLLGGSVGLSLEIRVLALKVAFPAFTVVQCNHDGILVLGKVISIIVVIVDLHILVLLERNIFGIVLVVLKLNVVVAAVLPLGEHLAALLHVVALEVLVEEAIVVAVGRKLGVVKFLVAIANALNVLGSIGNIRVVWRVIVVGGSVDRRAVNPLMHIVEKPPFLAASRLRVDMGQRPVSVLSEMLVGVVLSGLPPVSLLDLQENVIGRSARLGRFFMHLLEAHPAGGDSHEPEQCQNGDAG
jgi:hypothetical protein